MMNLTHHRRVWFTPDGFKMGVLPPLFCWDGIKSRELRRVQCPGLFVRFHFHEENNRSITIRIVISRHSWHIWVWERHRVSMPFILMESWFLNRWVGLYQSMMGLLFHFGDLVHLPIEFKFGMRIYNNTSLTSHRKNEEQPLLHRHRRNHRLHTKYEREAIS